MWHIDLLAAKCADALAGLMLPRTLVPARQRFQRSSAMPRLFVGSIALLMLGRFWWAFGVESVADGFAGAGYVLLAAAAAGSRWQTPRAIVVIVSALFWLPVLFAIGFDNEHIYSVVVSSVHFVRSLAAGSLSYWNHLVGLGTPQPFNFQMFVHPYTLLLMTLSAPAATALLLAGHGIIGALGMWYLVRYLRIGPWPAAVSCLTYTFCTPSLTYGFFNFWPTHLVTWTTAPWVAWVALLLLGASTFAARLKFAALLGLLFGLMMLNGQLPHVAAFGIGVAILVVASGRAFLARWQWFAFAVALAIAVAAFSLYSIYVEFVRFPDVDERAQGQSLIDYGKFFLYPFGTTRSFERERARTFGGVFALLSFYAIVSPGIRSPFKAGLVAAGVLCWLLSYMPVELTPFWGYNLDFQDAALLYGIALGGVALTHLARSSPRRALVAKGLAVVQLALMGFGAGWVWFERAQRLVERRDSAVRDTVLRDVFSERTVHRAIKARLRENSPNRIVVAPEMAADMFHTFAYDRSSFFFQDLRLINGVLRGIDAHKVQPNQALMFGQIGSNRALVKSDAALDFLGVEFVVAARRDKVPEGLEHVQTLSIEGAPAFLYQNTNALPEVILADPSVASLDPPEMDDCEHRGLLCRDFQSTLELVDHIPKLRAVRQSDLVEVTFPATTEPRVALLRDMYRPEWRATTHGGDGVPRELRTFEVLGGVIGVDVPVGTSSLTIWFDPAGRGVALRVTLFAALVGLGLFGASAVLDRRQQAQSSVISRHSAVGEIEPIFRQTWESQ